MVTFFYDKTESNDDKEKLCEVAILEKNIKSFVFLVYAIKNHEQSGKQSYTARVGIAISQNLQKSI